MEQPLTYQSFKCVLKYLEANKRIYITTQNPDISVIERKIPLHLDFLTFEYSSITLNNITYQLYSRINDEEVDTEDVPYPLTPYRNRDYFTDRTLLPGDIPLRSPIHSREEWKTGDRQTHPIFLYFEKDSIQHETLNHRVPEDLEYNMALKSLATFLLGARTKVLVKRLKVVYDWSFEILRLPLGLKLTTQELEVNPAHIECLIPIIDSNSLRKLKIMRCFWNDPCFELLIVQSVEKLYIKGISRRGGSSWNKTSIELPNRDITFVHWHLPRIEMEDFIQELLDDGKDIGTCYVVHYSFWVTLAIIEELGERLGRKVVKHYTKEMKDARLTSYSIFLPMTPTSELSICSDLFWCESHIRIEVVPISPVMEISTNSLMNRFSTIFSGILNRFGKGQI